MVEGKKINLEKMNEELYREKDFYPLFKVLRSWGAIYARWRDIRKTAKIKWINEVDMENLEKAGLVNSIPRRIEGDKWYRITTKGIEYVNSLDSYELNNKITFLTKIIILIGIFQLIFIGIQTIILLLK